ncbi:MAG: hypothetical protein ABSE39_03690 [Candidatus Bathyarchaeia archaeon]|jgi:hypothetical protein
MEPSDRLALDAFSVLTTSPFHGHGLIILAAVVLFVLVIWYVLKVKNTFAHIPRLEKPWVVLEGGVVLLFLGIVLIALKDVMNVSFGYLEDIDDGIIAASALFIFAAMVMLKKAWTVNEIE